MYSVEFAYKIVPSGEAEAGLGNPLIRQLAAIECGEGLQQAARSLGVSYRYFWGEIEAWEAKFGQKLVIREQGRRARLSPLGAKLLWAERTVMANHAVQIEKMRTELNAAFAAACDPEAEIVRIAGCFDPWLATLPAFLYSSHLIADLQFSTSVAGLEALASHDCDMAGFNYPRGAARGSTAARTFAPLIDPERIAMCRFASRTQGLAVANGNPLGITSLADVAEQGLRYAGRNAGTGTEVLLQDLCLAANVDPARLCLNARRPPIARGRMRGFASRMRRGRRVRISFRSPSKTTVLPGEGTPCPRRSTRFSRHCVRTNGATRPRSLRVFQVRPAGSTWMCGPNSAGGIEPVALSKALQRKALRKLCLDASQADAGGCIMAAEGRYPAAGRRVSSLPDVGGRRVPKGALGHFFLGEASS